MNQNFSQRGLELTLPLVLELEQVPMRFIFHKTVILFLSLCLLLLAACSTQSPSESEILLAKIGEKNISVTEFIRRAEYTVRPNYCNQNTPIHRKIILNSLIAEKLMALEAGDTNPIISAPEVRLQLRGRKEQAMRLEQFFRKAWDRVELDSSEIRQYFRHAGKEIQIEYFNAPDSVTAVTLDAQIKTGQASFESAFSSLSPLETIPRRTVTWTSFEHDLILENLFSQEFAPGQILGPLQIEDRQFLFLKIVNWQQSRPVITDQDVQERWQQVSERLRQRTAKKLYDQYIYSIMKGKQIEFSPQVLKKIIQLFGPVYFVSNETKHQVTQSGMFEQEPPEIDFEKFQTGLDQLREEVLFKVAGEVWTVQRFLDEIKAHPLVFRTKQMRSHEFGKQLQLAIIDLVRDVYLTEAAYRDGYDRLPGVQRDFRMWRDHLNYLYYKNQLLNSVNRDSADSPEARHLIDLHLNNEVNRLQKKYGNQIEINMEAFEKIRLTRIDMSVIQQHVPYAKPVPGFPQVTTDFRLDYGKKMVSVP